MGATMWFKAQGVKGQSLIVPGSELSVRVFLRTKFPNVLETLANLISLLGNLVGRPRRNQLEVPYLEATKTLEHVLQSV